MIRLLFLGGNGHSARRLDLVASALAARTAPGAPQTPGHAPPAPFELCNVPYPGFEGRPRAATFEAFLDDVAAHIADLRHGPTAVYASGIGGLLLFCLRSRGVARDLPAVLQAPVLWGLARRWMPRFMRLGLAQLALRRAFASPAFQRRFAKKHFRRPPAPEVFQAFFQGYEQCAALPDFFAWLTPALLADLTPRLRADPEALAGLTFLWGEHDHVVPVRELGWTEEALGRTWPVKVIPGWGHYPMIDDPESWIDEVARALETAR